MGFVDVFNHWQWTCSERLVMLNVNMNITKFSLSVACFSREASTCFCKASSLVRLRDFPGTDSFLGWAQQQTHTDFEVSESLKLTRTIRHLIPTRLMTNVILHKESSKCPLANFVQNLITGPLEAKADTSTFMSPSSSGCSTHPSASCWLPMNCLYQEASMKLRISDSNLLNNPARCLNRSLLINMDLRRTAMSKLPLQCLIGTTDPFRRNPHLCSTPTMFTCTVTQRSSQKLKLKHESISKSSRFQRKDWNPILH